MKKKFTPAIEGLKNAMRDRSIRIQFILACLAIIAGLFLRLDSFEWMAVILCIGLVICMEILNTAIEKTCDLISIEKDERIKWIKDLSAGGVLLACAISVIVAFLILYRHVIGV